jgi:hypothetical protein
MRSFRHTLHARALAGYAVLATAFSWPLPLRLGTHLVGVPAGDTGVYVWNLWVFSHELTTRHAHPLFTSTIFSLDTRADLSLHNYTIFADLLAVPLLPLFGVVGTFNVLYLLMLVVNGYAMFLLARHVSRGAVEAWLAGALFAFAPCLIARSTAHFSLVMAAPLPLFVLLLRRMDQRPGWATAAAAGTVLAWAALCDPYYGVYCLLLGAWHLTARSITVRFSRRGPHPRAWYTMRSLDVLTVLVGALVAWVAATGGTSIGVLGQTLHMRTLYTPVLMLAVLVLAGIAARVHTGIAVRQSPLRVPLLRLAPCAASCSILLMSPVLYALGTRVAQGRYVTPTVFWRTSTPGVDLLSFLAPNPNHPLFSGLSKAWLTREPGGFEENVASITFVALLAIVCAVRWGGFRLPRYWTALGLLCAAVTAGPFVRLGGVFTYVPTPWAIARYLPIIGGARAPARFMAVVMVAVAVLFALALKALGDRFPSRRRVILVVASCALLFELLPAPRALHSAEVPAIYRQIASDPRHIRVLELPFGVRSGIWSVGNFSAASQFYQTFHHKPLIGGYLSRVSQHRVAAMRRRPILDALIHLSEGRDVSPDLRRSLRAIGPSFVERARVGYVVVDRSRAAATLIDFAVDVLRLEKIGEAGERELYRPVPPVR